eukprot:m.68007 g.68007  ORF g.68007 m.68007 type:complete len:235 (+) comp12184_c0_seq1:330-1034(+)
MATRLLARRTSPLWLAMRQPQQARNLAWFSSKKDEQVEESDKQKQTTATEADDQASTTATAQDTTGAESAEDTPPTENPELVEARASAAEFKDKYLRSLAEMENLRTRTREQVAEAKDFAIRGFAKDLLSVSDVLQMAIENVSQDELDKNEPLNNLFDGLKATQQMLTTTFKRHELVEVIPEGEPFDPNMHEAMFTVPHPDLEPNTVLQVTRTGWALKGRVLRAAQVGVVAKSS